jgi:hypothetical protein
MYGAISINSNANFSFLLSSERNSEAKLHNSNLNSSDEPLEQMYNITTGQKIDHFPATPGHIAGLQGRTVNGILTALGLASGGSLTEKKERLRIAVGLKGNPA